jgi:hypothetical protein
MDLGKWSAAAPLAQNLLARGGEPAQRTRCLKWLQKIAEMFLKENNRAEALRVVLEARPYLAQEDQLTEAFDKLEKQAGGRE